MLSISCCVIVGRYLTISTAQDLINGTKLTLMKFREEVETFNRVWFKDIEKLAASVNVEPNIPRRCGRQVHRGNVPTEEPSKYYMQTVTIPFLGL